jgi:hypothetical protein
LNGYSLTKFISRDKESRCEVIVPGFNIIKRKGTKEVIVRVTLSQHQASQHGEICLLLEGGRGS